MDYTTRKENPKQDLLQDHAISPTVRYVQKKSNGTVKSSLVFSLKPRTPQGVKRLRIKGTLEG